MQAPGETAPCPRGEYKDGFDAASSCKKCAEGVTTPDVASTAETDCKILLRSYAPTSIVGGVIKTTQRCPQRWVDGMTRLYCCVSDNRLCTGGLGHASVHVLACCPSQGATVISAAIMRFAGAQPWQG